MISSPLPDTSRVRGECNEDEDDEESEGDCRCPASCSTIYGSVTYSDESRHSPPSSPSLLGSRVNTHETAARSCQLRDSNDVVLPEGRRKGSRKCSTQQQQDSASSSLGTSPQTSLARESLTSRDSGCHTDGLVREGERGYFLFDLCDFLYVLVRGLLLIPLWYILSPLGCLVSHSIFSHC